MQRFLSADCIFNAISQPIRMCFFAKSNTFLQPQTHFRSTFSENYQPDVKLKGNQAINLNGTFFVSAKKKKFGFNFFLSIYFYNHKYYVQQKTNLRPSTTDVWDQFLEFSLILLF